MVFSIFKKNKINKQFCRAIPPNSRWIIIFFTKTLFLTHSPARITLTKILPKQEKTQQHHKTRQKCSVFAKKEAAFCSY
jgi:hypothetical protein